MGRSRRTCAAALRHGATGFAAHGECAVARVRAPVRALTLLGRARHSPLGRSRMLPDRRCPLATSRYRFLVLPAAFLMLSPVLIGCGKHAAPNAVQSEPDARVSRRTADDLATHF